MAQLTQTQLAAQQGQDNRRPGESIREWAGHWPARLLIILLITELIFPFLIWRLRLPRILDFSQDMVAGVIMAITVLYMLSRNRIPPVVLVILAATLIWGMVALFEGQGMAATAWGWWKFFKYPIIGLYAYLVVRWPRGFADWWMRFLIGVMLFEVIVQLIRLALGEPPGDSLAGTFGQKGVGPHTSFNMFVVALAFGSWIATRKWKILLIALALGLAASMMNVTKFYIPGVFILGAATLGLQLIAGGRFKQLFIFVVVFGLLAAAAVPLFNRFIADTRGLPELQEYLQPDRLDRYLFSDGKGDEDGRYNLGRALSVTYAMQIVSRDPTTLLFGMGLGARSNSTGLGIVGTGLENDLYGGAEGTGLLIRIQEQGIVGLATMWLFSVWIMLRLYQDAKRHDNEALKTLEYGLILYSLFWPLWLWYQNPWTHGVMMILYWTTVGFVFSEI